MSHSIHANKLLNAGDIKEYFKEYNELLTELYNKLINRVKDKLGDAKNFSDFVIEAIIILKEEAHTLHGSDKKEIATDLVKSVVEQMEISDEDKTELKEKVYPTLDNTIDLYISAAKGYMFIQKIDDKIDDSCAKCQSKCGGGTKLKRRGSHNKKNKSSKIVRSGEAVIEAPHTPEGTVDVTALSNVVYDELRGMITHKQVGIANIISIVTLAMQLVQQFAGVSGSDKKKIVINVINRVVDEIPMSPADKAAVQAIVATTLDKTIDFVVAVASGEIDLLGLVEENVARCKLMCGCA